MSNGSSKVLILHGWGSCAKNWNQVKKILEISGYKVFLPDLPGFGQNPEPKNVWSIDNYVSWLEDYCEKENLSQIFVLGHSFGGAIAIKFTLKNTEKVKGLFLIAPALVRVKTFKKKILKKIAKIFYFLPKKIKKIIYQRIIKSDYPLEPGIMRETYLKIIKEDLSEVLHKIKTQTIIVWGEKDKITPIKEAYLIKNKIKNGPFWELSKVKLEIIPNIGHNPHREAPEKLAGIIINFLKTRN